MKYILTPLTEGQNLNYCETLSFKTKKEVSKRAQEISKGLQTLLPNGTFSCQVQTDKQYLVSSDTGFIVESDGTITNLN